MFLPTAGREEWIAAEHSISSPVAGWTRHRSRQAFGPKFSYDPLGTTKEVLCPTVRNVARKNHIVVHVDNLWIAVAVVSLYRIYVHKVFQLVESQEDIVLVVGLLILRSDTVHHVVKILHRGTNAEMNMGLYPRYLNLFTYVKAYFSRQQKL